MVNPKITRRQVLVLGGLTLGTATMSLAGLDSPALAGTTNAAITLVPIAASPVVVLPGVGVEPAAFPRQLAVQVQHPGVVLPTGTQVVITYDPRLYAPLPAALATVNGRPLGTVSVTATDPKTAVTTCTVTFTEAVASGDDPVVVVGTAFPVLYPLDLVRGPADTLATVGQKNATPDVRRSLQPSRPSTYGGVATPWGIEVSGVWSRYEWAKGTRWYYYPVRVSLQSVGPGAVPLPASFSIALDSRVIRDVTIIKAQLNYKAHDAGARLISHQRTSRLQENSWRTGVVLKAGDRLDLYLGVTVQGLTKDLPTIKHPAVTLINMGNHVTQRQTGRNGISRNDSKWA
jgi:hypothetical protein